MVNGTELYVWNHLPKKVETWIAGDRQDLIVHACRSGSRPWPWWLSLGKA